MAYRYKPLLTILVWGLILEVLTAAYYISVNKLDRFEFLLALALLAITAASIAIVLRKIVKEARG